MKKALGSILMSSTLFMSNVASAELTNPDLINTTVGVLNLELNRNLGKGISGSYSYVLNDGKPTAVIMFNVGLNKTPKEIKDTAIDLKPLKYACKVKSEFDGIGVKIKQISVQYTSAPSYDHLYVENYYVNDCKNPVTSEFTM